MARAGVCDSGRPCRGPGLAGAQDGSRYSADTVITALRDESGQLRRVLEVTRDITEQRQANLSLQAYAAQSVPGGTGAARP